MSTIFRWIRQAIRALLIFIAVTAMLGATYWVVGRHSIRDWLGAVMVALGWLGIGFVMHESGRPSLPDEW